MMLACQQLSAAMPLLHSCTPGTASLASCFSARHGSLKLATDTTSSPGSVPIELSAACVVQLATPGAPPDVVGLYEDVNYVGSTSIASVFSYSSAASTTNAPYGVYLSHTCASSASRASAALQQS